MQASAVVTFVLVFGLGSATADEWRFPVGLTYVSGAGDVVEQFEDNLRADGYTTDSVEGLPLGISFQPYYELDSGIGFGMGLGPLMVIYGDTDFLNIPVNACLRYAMMLNSSTSVYFRAGVSYNLADGDYVEESQPGFLGAIGFEFMRNRKVSFGIEMGYDSSTIEIEDRTAFNSNDTEEFEPTGFMASVFAVF